MTHRTLPSVTSWEAQAPQMDDRYGSGPCLTVAQSTNDVILNSLGVHAAVNTHLVLCL